jgi:hypothetical protein
LMRSHLEDVFSVITFAIILFLSCECSEILYEYLDSCIQLLVFHPEKWLIFKKIRDVLVVHSR